MTMIDDLKTILRRLDADDMTDEEIEEARVFAQDITNAALRVFRTKTRQLKARLQQADVVIAAAEKIDSMLDESADNGFPLEAGVFFAAEEYRIAKLAFDAMLNEVAVKDGPRVMSASWPLTFTECGVVSRLIAGDYVDDATGRTCAAPVGDVGGKAPSPRCPNCKTGCMVPDGDATYCDLLCGYRTEPDAIADAATPAVANPPTDTRPRYSSGEVPMVGDVVTNDSGNIAPVTGIDGDGNPEVNGVRSVHLASDLTLVRRASPEPTNVAAQGTKVTLAPRTDYERDFPFDARAEKAEAALDLAEGDRDAARLMYRSGQKLYEASVEHSIALVIQRDEALAILRDLVDADGLFATNSDPPEEYTDAMDRARKLVKGEK